MVLQATVWDESFSTCSCCGEQTRTFWGDVSGPDAALAVYYVHYTVGGGGGGGGGGAEGRAPETALVDLPIIDLIVGTWGDDASPEDRVAVTMAYKPGPDGGLMIIDAAGRPSDDREICARALARAEVVGTSFAQNVFRMVDAVFLQDPRMKELVELARTRTTTRALTGTSMLS